MFAGRDISGGGKGGMGRKRTIIRIPIPTRFTSGFNEKIRLEIVDAGRSFFRQFDEMAWQKRGKRGEREREREREIEWIKLEADSSRISSVPWDW